MKNIQLNEKQLMDSPDSQPSSSSSAVDDSVVSSDDSEGVSREIPGPLLVQTAPIRLIITLTYIK